MFKVCVKILPQTFISSFFQKLAYLYARRNKLLNAHENIIEQF